MPSPENIRAKILDLVKQYYQEKFAPKSFDPEKDLIHYAGRVFDAEEIVNLVDAGLDFYLTANPGECLMLPEPKRNLGSGQKPILRKDYRRRLSGIFQPDKLNRRLYASTHPLIDSTTL
jgi:hypothetical protein